MTHWPHTSQDIWRGTRVEGFSVQVLGHVRLQQDILLGLQFVVHFLGSYHSSLVEEVLAGEGTLGGFMHTLSEGHHSP